MGRGLPQLRPFVGTVSKFGNRLWRGGSSARPSWHKERGVAWSQAWHRRVMSGGSGTPSCLRCPRAFVSVAFPGECARPPLRPPANRELGFEQDAVPMPPPFVIGKAASHQNLGSGCQEHFRTGSKNRRPCWEWASERRLHGYGPCSPSLRHLLWGALFSQKSSSQQ